ncbi:MAG: amino acid racemase [Pseudomonadota bacterium]
MRETEKGAGGGEEPVVGVLGGMGPAATIDLLQRVLALTPATSDSDHLRMLVDNNPKVPSRIAALIEGTGESPAPTLIAMARGLEAQGAEFLVMPCNTAHHYHREVAAAVAIPFLNLMDLVRSELDLMAGSPRRIGLLASSALRRIELYEPYVNTAQRELLYPSPACQDDLMGLILAVKAGRVERSHLRALSAAIDDLCTGGADVLLVACTEISALGDALVAECPVVDAADVLARAVVSAVRNTGP